MRVYILWFVAGLPALNIIAWIVVRAEFDNDQYVLSMSVVIDTYTYVNAGVYIA